MLVKSGEFVVKSEWPAGLLKTADQSEPIAGINQLREVEEIIAETIFVQSNQLRQKYGLPQCQKNVSLQRAAKIRAAEVLITPSHQRPNGSEGCEAAYELGFSAEGTIEGEAISQMEARDLDWLKEKGGSTLWESLLTVVPDFLQTSQGTVQAVGVAIKPMTDKYRVAFVFLSGSLPLVDKHQLAECYEQTNRLQISACSLKQWNDLVLLKAKAQELYRRPDVTQTAIDHCTTALAQLLQMIN